MLICTYSLLDVNLKSYWYFYPFVSHHLCVSINWCNFAASLSSHGSQIELSWITVGEGLDAAHLHTFSVLQDRLKVKYHALTNLSDLRTNSPNCGFWHVNGYCKSNWMYYFLIIFFKYSSISAGQSPSILHMLFPLCYNNTVVTQQHSQSIIPLLNISWHCSDIS